MVRIVNSKVAAQLGDRPWAALGRRASALAAEITAVLLRIAVASDTAASLLLRFTRFQRDISARLTARLLV